MKYVEMESYKKLMRIYYIKKAMGIISTIVVACFAWNYFI